MKQKCKSALILSALLVTASSQAASLKDNILQGKIVDWPVGKTGVLHLGLNGRESTVASAPIDEQGNFELLLPTSGALLPVSEFFSQKSNYDSNCQGDAKATASGDYYQTGELTVWMDDQRLGDIQLESSARQLKQAGDIRSSLIYFNKPTSLQGKLSCALANSIPPAWALEFTGRYPTGWNIVRQEFAGKKSGDWDWRFLPAQNVIGLDWRLYEEFGGVGISPSGNTRTVQSVMEGGSAEKAGLRAGDEIISVNGQSVKDWREIVLLVRGEPNTKVVLLIKRDGKELAFELTRAVMRVP